MKIKYGSVFGNYRWDAEAEVSAEAAELLAPLGALQIAQRSPSTAAEKQMAGYDKRPKGFSRSDIPFSAEHAEVLKNAMSVLVIENDDSKIEIPATVSVVEYIAPEQDVKMNDERNAYARHGKAKTLATLAKKVGFAGDVGDGQRENAPVEFLRAIRSWSKDQIANA